MSQKYDVHFKTFTASLEQLLAGYDVVSDRNFTEQQKLQVENLVRLETEWRQALIRSQYGQPVYKAFVHFITEERRNILAARPYFRERQETFKIGVSPALANKEEMRLYQYGVNYNFIAFALKHQKFPKNSKILKLAAEVVKARNELIELNIPMAISRAKLFKCHTPKSHLEYMDLVQIANEGLITAVDKFVLPYIAINGRSVFRAVIIGRISGNLIKDYSQTMVRFFPADKRKLYRANKAHGRNADVSPEEISDKVNKEAVLKEFEKANLTDPLEIHRLMAAASHVSIDTPIVDQSIKCETSHESGVDHYAAPEECRPDVQVEENEARAVLRKAISELSLLERKILQMKGIDLT